MLLPPMIHVFCMKPLITVHSHTFIGMTSATIIMHDRATWNFFWSVATAKKKVILCLKNVMHELSLWLVHMQLSQSMKHLIVFMVSIVLILHKKDKFVLKHNYVCIATRIIKFLRHMHAVHVHCCKHWYLIIKEI